MANSSVVTGALRASTRINAADQIEVSPFAVFSADYQAS
jgi:hypothetical protein